jgi:hypothetical protein
VCSIDQHFQRKKTLNPASEPHEERRNNFFFFFFFFFSKMKNFFERKTELSIRTTGRVAKNIRGALPSAAKALAMLRGESSEDDDDSETDKSELSSFVVVVEALIVTPLALLVRRLVILEGKRKEEHDSCCNWRVESMLEEMAPSKNGKKTNDASRNATRI